MKWVSLLWSVVLLGFLALFFAYISSRPSTSVLSPILLYVTIFWIAVCIVSPIILTLRLLRIILSPASFIYILTGTANLAIGILGIYYIAPADKVGNNMGTLFILSLNTITGCFVYIDAFIKTIPGIRKGEKP